MTTEYPNEHFPGTQLDMDLMCAVARIKQIEDQGTDCAGGVVLHRLITCDAPRLRGHMSLEALEWMARERGPERG